MQSRKASWLLILMRIGFTPNSCEQKSDAIVDTDTPNQVTGKTSDALFSA